ncbi:type IV toxin-antitoxin system AbiEi family antitoxin domain-containing protein [Citrifermentans bremense]|uniref:type IV toxin-antitoxin system AbiEi family antitoxin domain-containing protein n=1 Tax=Citrifermentans bremense TaxID=60035 RepID=UPI00041237AA|nr:hypothetical protein [Citrifermentans bremense]
MRKNPLANIPFEEFDYQMLLDALQEYRQPRMKINRLLADVIIVRIKKGLYIFGESTRRRPFSREILANLCYGPSYISLQYALHYHGLTPERVETVTSVTTGRSRAFSTPVGQFSYRTISLEAFPAGMGQYDLADGRHFLMATPEKALADTIVADRGTGIVNVKEMREYLAGLRVDQSVLKDLDRKLLANIAQRYRSRRLRFLCDLVGWL